VIQRRRPQAHDHFTGGGLRIGRFYHSELIDP